MAPIADGVLSIRSCVNRWMCFVKQIPRGACAKSSPRANCLHSICISASMHNTTKHTENKREHRGGERTDRPNNKLNHQRLSLTLCVCVCACQRGSQKARAGQGRWRQMQKGRERQRAAEKTKDRGRNQICKNITKSCISDKREHTGVFV